MKLLATDYDGTLCYGYGDVMPEDLDAIRRWKEAGNLFAVVTGRSGLSIHRELDKYDLNPDFIICNNGGLVFDGEGRRLSENYMETITAIDLVYAMKEMDDVCSVMVNDGMARHKICVNPQLEDPRYPGVKADLPEDEALSLPRYCHIVVSMTDSQAAEDMAEQINHFFGDHLAAYPNNTCVDVVAKGVNKGEGLQFALSWADVDEEDVYVLGDSWNDLPMIEAVPNSAAIVTAPEAVKAQASRTCTGLSELVGDLLA